MVFIEAQLHELMAPTDDAKIMSYLFWWVHKLCHRGEGLKEGPPHKDTYN